MKQNSVSPIPSNPPRVNLLTSNSSKDRQAWEEGTDKPPPERAVATNGDLKKVSLTLQNESPTVGNGIISKVDKNDSRPQTANSTQRKSAWERAQERYKEQERKQQEGGGSSIQQLNLHDSEIQLDVNCLSFSSVAKVFKTKRFTDLKLEWLYQRYFFKLNQKNLTVLMALIATLCIVLITFHYVGGARSLAKGICLGFIFVTLVILAFLSNRNAFSHVQLVVFCYSVIVLLLIIVIVVTVETVPQTASGGVWITIFGIYMVYTLLPVRMRLSVASGVALATIQVICSLIGNHADWARFLWKQVSLKSELFL